MSVGFWGLECGHITLQHSDRVCTPWNATLRHVKIFIASVKPFGLKNQDNVALDGSNPNLKKAIYMVKYRIIIQMAIGTAPRSPLFVSIQKYCTNL